MRGKSESTEKKIRFFSPSFGYKIGNCEQKIVIKLLLLKRLINIFF